MAAEAFEGESDNPITVIIAIEAAVAIATDHHGANHNLGVGRPGILGFGPSAFRAWFAFVETETVEV